MKLLFKIFFVFLIFSSAVSSAEDMKICESGILKCKPIIKDKDKYKRCMKLVCAEEEEPKAKSRVIELPKTTPQKRIKICEAGKKRCDSLKKRQMPYYECIDKTCSDPALKKENPSCFEGHNACSPELEEYKACVKLNCGSEKECGISKRLCSNNLARYWHCVYRICLGPVDQFKKTTPSKIEKYIVIKDEKGRKKKVIINRPEKPLSGAWPAYVNAPKGIDDEEWIRDIPSKFIITGNPSKYMRCLDSTSVIDCRTRDLRSCGCSDGTKPIMINGIPKPLKVNE